MPRLFNKALNRWELVPNEAVDLAVQSGEYEIPDGLQVAVETPSGFTAPASLDDVQAAEGDLPLATQADVGAEEEKAYLAREYGGSGEGLKAFGEGVLQGASLGGYGALQRLLEPEAAERSRARAEVQEGPRFAGELVGAVAPAVAAGGAGLVGRAAALTPAGAAAKLGAGIAAKRGGVGGAALGLGTEGAIAGAGAGVGQASMSEDPLTLEHALSTISTNAVLGAGIGSAAGVLGKVAEKGLARARRAVDASAAEAQAAEQAIGEVGRMDKGQLRAAKADELARVEAEELVPARAQLADDIRAYREEAKSQKPWIAMEGLKKGEKGSPELRVLGKDYLDADRKLDKLLRDPKTMAEEPWIARKALREQEAALNRLKAEGPAIEGRLAEEASGVTGSRRIPTWEKLASEKRVTKTVPFEDIEPHLISIEGTIGGRMESIREGVKAGKSITTMGKDTKRPIDLTVLPSGKLFVEDGRHRLRVMAEMAAKGEKVRARVRFSKGVDGVENGTVPMFPDALARRTVTSSQRLQALQSVDGLLERNAALQARMAELTPARLGGPAVTSPKLQAIQAADDALANAPAATRGIAEDAAIGYAAAAATGVLPGGPIAAAAAIGARRGLRKLGDWVFGRMGKAADASRQRSAKVMSAILGGSERVARTGPPLASRVLSRVSFGGDDEPVIRERPQPRREGAVGAFLARERELREQTSLGPDGKIRINPTARERIAERLKGVAAVDPLTADAMETAMVRRIEYAATKLPKRPDMGVMQLGPDRWVPNQMEVRAFARIVAALEDPGGVEERLTRGTVTPDEAEAYREVYPERFADFQRQLIEGLGSLKKRPPYATRLALSIFTGVPMDPALSPPILKVLQGVHLEEEGSEGGEQAPRAQPQFGSITRENPTKAQERSQG